MAGSARSGLIISALMMESLTSQWKEFEKTGENRIITGDNGRHVRARRQMRIITSFIWTLISPCCNWTQNNWPYSKRLMWSGKLPHTHFAVAWKCCSSAWKECSSCPCDASAVASLGLHRNQSFLNGAIHKTGEGYFRLLFWLNWGEKFNFCQPK